MAKKVYVLLRVGFGPEDNGLERAITEEGISYVPVAVFATEKAAEEECERLTEEAVNTISFVQALSTVNLETTKLIKAIKSADLPTPKLKTPKRAFDWQTNNDNRKSFSDWWKKHIDKITPELNAAFWRACMPEWHFYKVQESKLV